MSWIEIIEWVSLLSGIAYVLLEIGQLRAMWWVGILTGVSCALSFGFQGAWASMGLNVYYAAISVWGLRQWGRDKTEQGSAPGDILIRRPSRGVLFLSAALLLIGTPLLAFGIAAAGDPAPWLDGLAFTLSAIATWWLGRSYPQQWLLWIVADTISTVLSVALGAPLLALLYGVYTLSAVYGWWHWKTKGNYIQ